MRFSFALLALILVGNVAFGQGPPAPAVIVNGEPIAEATVQRSLKNAPAEMKAKARADLISFLIDNLLIDQHLRAAGPTAPAELDARMQLIKQEATKNNVPFDKLLAQLALSEEELKAQVAADLRWEKYCKSQFPDAKLQEFFTANRTFFDGSEVTGRHILVAVAANADPATRQQAKAKLAAIKKSLEDQAAAEAGKKTPAGADALLANSTRMKETIDAFCVAAAKDSDCPSKRNGGDIGSFGRTGRMVEPFAKAAFALQIGQVSDVVETEFGYHLILITAKTPGRDVKFDEVKDQVFEVCSERLREQMLPGLKQKATIKVTSAP